MIENTRSINIAATIILVVGITFILFPLAIAFITATQSYQAFVAGGGLSFRFGLSFFENLTTILHETRLPHQLWNSIIIALIVAVTKVSFCFLAAFALVFIQSKWSKPLFAIMIATVMLPLDLRVITTYQIVSNVAMPLNWILDFSGIGWIIEQITGGRPYLSFSLLGTYVGTAAPIAANATAVFIFRQFFMTLPRDLPKAATMDGAGPLRFMVDILVPLSKTPMVAIFLLFFIGGWTAYLWPLVAATTPDQQTAVVGLAQLANIEPDDIPDIPLLMTGALFVSFIPVLIIALMQRQIVQGLNLSEK